MKVVRWVMLLAAVVALVGTFYMFWQVRRHPLEISARIGRDELGRRGLVPRRFEGPRGPLVAWTRPGQGPVLVLVHGEDAGAAVWAPLVSRLPRGRALVVPDLPGHGESAPAEGALTLDELVSGLALVLEDLPAGGGYVLVGHSLGAVVALEAVRTGTAPRPELLVLVAPWTLGPAEAGFAALFPRDEKAALELLRREQRVRAPPVPDFLPPARVRRAASGPLARLRDDLRRRLPYRWRPAGVATLIVAPAEDQIMPAERLAALAAALDAPTGTLAACGHLPHRECPDALAELLAGRIADLSGGRAARPGARREAPGARAPAR